MPEHTSVAKDVCVKWIEELGFYLPGKCSNVPQYQHIFFGAYLGNRYKKSSPDVNTYKLINP